MRMCRKLLAVLMTVLLCVGVLAMPAYAATTSQDGLEVTLTTDKEVYAEGETIEATLTVTNTGDAEVTNVALESLIPEGYQLKDGSEATKVVESLAAGETVTLEVSFVAENAGGDSEDPTEGDDSEDPTEGDDSEEPTTGSDAEDPTTGGNSENPTVDPDDEGSDEETNGSNNSGNSSDNPDTGDNSNVGLWIALMLVAVIGVVVLVVVFGKQWKRMMSLVLCMAMAAAMFGGIAVSANATEVLSGTISVSEEITVGNASLTINAVVKYGADTEEGDEIVGLPKPEDPSPADDYYWDTSIVIDVINADESEDVLTEAEAKALLEERGFCDYPVTYNCSIHGEYLGDIEVLDNSADTRPMYWTYYLSSSGDIWSIYVINDRIMAYPVSYMLEADSSIEVLVSESNEVTGYDPETNKFYINIPFESTSRIIVVDRIDAETLDKLTIEEID